MGVEAKICGLTRGIDAALAVRLGARYLGVVFADSSRQVDAGKARDIVAAGDGVPVVGVFVSHSVDAILRLRDATGLSVVQLHGDYDAPARRRCRDEQLEVWVVRHLGGTDDLRDLSVLGTESDVVLVEPRVPGAMGGTGVTLDLELASDARAQLASGRMALAGGLRPQSLRHAIEVVRPDIVDVSSGVDSAPGIKDADLVARFLEAARDG
jgi:phosphoribosylanthranilate isomerase